MFLAVDVGGSKTLVACFDGKGQLKTDVKFSTPQDYESWLEHFKAAVAELKCEDFAAGAIAIPGLVDRERGIAIAYGNLPWREVPIVEDVERLLHCPIVLENDAKAAGLAEAKLLKNEFRKVLYVTIGTGIGNAIIIDGKIDPDFADSEGGQILLEHQGKLEQWEDFASGKAIEKQYGKKASDITDPQAWYMIARNIALGLIDLVATLTPDVIILGGGIGAHLDKFQSRLAEQMKIYENPLFKMPPIRKAQHPEEAVIYGCYELTKERYAHAHKKTA